MVRSEREVRLQKIDLLREQGINPYPSKAFERTHTVIQIIDLFDKSKKVIPNGEADPESQSLRTCGRVVSKRESKKTIYMDLQDFSGEIQLVVIKNEFANDQDLTCEKLTKLLDEGDFIGIQGVGYRTKRGQLSILVSIVEILSKATMPFPDSYYGVKDIERLRRYREIDMVSTRETLNRFAMRSKIVKSIRDYLNQNEFYEIETPIFQTVYGGASARPFITYHNSLDTNLYLRIATELFLKRAICGGFEKVYEVGRVFRNEGIDATHNPEFTSLEAYQAYADYFDMIKLVEVIICNAAEVAGLNLKEIQYQGYSISLEGKYDYSDVYPTLNGLHWRIKTMVEAVRDETGLNFDEFKDVSQALKEIQKLDLEISELDKQSVGNLLYAVFDRKVEETLIQPTFIIDFPVEVSPLAKTHRSKPQYTERFEMFLAGQEFSNCFSELNDPVEQRKRFEAQLARKQAGDDEAMLLDEDFLQALSLGMPTCAGLSIGIDRLAMLLTNSMSIRDIVMFPTMKPYKKQD
ncbi:MAG: lysine--tRNA ligase [Cyanobacteria bacterium P01_D01_bin.56]